MTHVNRGCTNVAQAIAPGAQAELDVLQISPPDPFRKHSDSGEAVATDVEAESDAVRDGDDRFGINVRGGSIELENGLLIGNRIWFERPRKTRNGKKQGTYR